MESVSHCFWFKGKLQTESHHLPPNVAFPLPQSDSLSHNMPLMPFSQNWGASQHLAMLHLAP